MQTAPECIYMKGAPEVVLGRCMFSVDTDGRHVPMTDKELKEINDAVEHLEARSPPRRFTTPRPTAIAAGCIALTGHPSPQAL